MTAHEAAAALRLLTPLGRGMLLVGTGSLALAIWLNWQEFTQLGVVALGLVLLGVLWQALPGLPEIRVTLAPDRLVEGGGRARARLLVESGLTPMLHPKLSLPVGEETVLLRLPFLGPYRHHEEWVDLPSLPRGAYDVGPVAYEKSDPLGTVARRFTSGGRGVLLVAPRTLDLPVFAGGLTNDLEGATSQQLSMSDLAFHALREYIPGDDLRHVHWRSSAKAGELLVRQYHETRRGHVTVLLDPSEHSYSGAEDFELAVSCATSIALRAVRDDFDTYLRCGSHVARGRDVLSMTDAACHFTAGADVHAATASEAAAAVTGTGLVVQVTGAQRSLEDLTAVARGFDAGAGWVVVRADSSTSARMRDSHELREISVPDLERLRDLFSRGLR